MSWLDWRALGASVLAMAGTNLNQLETDPIAFAITTIGGGLILGALITWAMKRWPKI